MGNFVAMRTDQELLADYASGGSEAAFAELVSRHSRMVYRTCLRLLGNGHDAEEATQAVFLALAREPRAFRPVASLAGWLHGVAGNVGRMAVRSRARRIRHEEEAAMIRPVQGGDGGREAGGESGRNEALAMLDREIDALPSAQRQAVLLRYLEGHSQEEAARLAGCPQGTLARRAQIGLDRLRERLAQHGAVLSAAGLIAVLDAEAGAAMPAALLPSILATSKLAATGVATGAAGIAGAQYAVPVQLAEGVLRMMFWTKIKVAAAVCAAVLAVVGGGGALATRLLAAESTIQKVGTAAKDDVLECRVTALLGGGRVELSAGADQGLRPDFELDVDRDGQKVGIVRVTAVEPKTAIAELVSATGQVQVGDRAATRFRVVAQPASQAGSAQPGGGAWIPGNEAARKASEARRGKTELSKLAASMKPGDWAELKTEMPAGLWGAPKVGPSKGLSIATWSDDAHWDSHTGQCLYFGVRQSRKLVAYSEEKNAWRNIPFDGEPNAPAILQKFGHQYSQNSLDSERSRFFTSGACYDIRTGKWSNVPSGGGGMTWEYFSAMDCLLSLERGEGLSAYSEEKKAWQNLGKFPVHGYHSLARHNPFRQEVLFAGGNDSHAVAVIDKDGKFRKMKDFPSTDSLTIRNDSLTVDPLSGRYLFHSGKRLVEFDSKMDEYRPITDDVNVKFEVVTFIPEYGVTMWAGSKVWLYKPDPARDDKGGAAAGKGITCAVADLVPDGKAILDAGFEQGVKTGFEFEIERAGNKIATARVVGVQPNSAMAELVRVTGEIQPGDKAAWMASNP